MDNKLFKILKKVYYKKKYEKDENGYQHRTTNGDRFDCNTKTTTYALDNLSHEESDYLISSGYPVNEIVTYSHDECVKRYKEILRHPNLTLENLLAAYLRLMFFVIGKYFRLRRLAPVTRAVPSFEFLGALPFNCVSERKLTLPYSVLSLQLFRSPYIIMTCKFSKKVYERKGVECHRTGTAILLLFS